MQYCNMSPSGNVARTITRIDCLLWVPSWLDCKSRRARLRYLIRSCRFVRYKSPKSASTKSGRYPGREGKIQLVRSYAQVVAAIVKRDLRRAMIRACISVIAFLLRIHLSGITGFSRILFPAPPAAPMRGFIADIERFEKQNVR